MEGMGVQAIAAYIQELADQQGRSHASVAVEGGVEPGYLWRLRRGQIKEPSARVIFALVQAVNGNLQITANLLLDPQSTERDGINAASLQQELDSLSSLITSVKDFEREDLVDLLSMIRRILQRNGAQPGTELQFH